LALPAHSFLSPSFSLSKSCFVFVCSPPVFGTFVVFAHCEVCVAPPKPSAWLALLARLPVCNFDWKSARFFALSSASSSLGNGGGGLFGARGNTSRTVVFSIDSRELCDSLESLLMVFQSFGEFLTLV
jgi:hypothetical protein